MAIKVNGTTVIDDSRNLSNVGGLKTVGGSSILGSGDISVGGSGQGAEVWCNCDTSPVTNRDSLNISSLSNPASAAIRYTFTNAFDSANHATSSQASNDNNIAGNDSDGSGSHVQTSSTVQIQVYDRAGSTQNADYLTMCVHGDLA